MHCVRSNLRRLVSRSLEFCWCLLACSRRIARSCWALCLRFRSLASTFRRSLSTASSDIIAYTHHTCKRCLRERRNLAPRMLLGSSPSLSKPSIACCVIGHHCAYTSNVACAYDEIPPLGTHPTITYVIAFQSGTDIHTYIETYNAR